MNIFYLAIADFALVLIFLYAAIFFKLRQLLKSPSVVIVIYALDLLYTFISAPFISISFAKSNKFSNEKNVVQNSGFILGV